ncbi:Transcriptional activator hap5 [Saitoella coloradoensis]
MDRPDDPYGYEDHQHQEGGNMSLQGSTQPYPQQYVTHRFRAASRACEQHLTAVATRYEMPVVNQIVAQFWQQTVHNIETEDHDFKVHSLPIARIKKVMKTDEDVKMIAAEAPILFAKGCEVFIEELTMRAWQHAEENKRRTLQRSDIANAIQKSDMYDFLIDIVPREEAAHGHRATAAAPQPQLPPAEPISPPVELPDMNIQQQENALDEYAFEQQAYAARQAPPSPSRAYVPQQAAATTSSGGFPSVTIPRQETTESWETPGLNGMYTLDTPGEEIALPNFGNPAPLPQQNSSERNPQPAEQQSLLPHQQNGIDEQQNGAEEVEQYLEGQDEEDDDEEEEVGLETANEGQENA